MWNCNCGYTNAGAKRKCTRCRMERFLSPAISINAGQLQGAPTTAPPPGGLLRPMMDTNRHEDEYQRQIRGLAKQGRGRDTHQHPHASVQQTKHPRAKNLLLHQGVAALFHAFNHCERALANSAHPTSSRICLCTKPYPPNYLLCFCLGIGGVGAPVINEKEHAEGPLRVVTERISRRRICMITTAIPNAAHLAAALHPIVGLVAPDFHFTQPAEVINRLTQATQGQPVDSICFLDVGGPDNQIRLLKGLDLSLWALNDKQDKTGVQSFMLQVANLVHPQGRIDLLGKNLYNTQEGQQLCKGLEQLTGRVCTYNAVMMNTQALHLHQHLAGGGPEHKQVLTAAFLFSGLLVITCHLSFRLELSSETPFHTSIQIELISGSTRSAK